MVNVIYKYDYVWTFFKEGKSVKTDGIIATGLKRRGKKKQRINIVLIKFQTYSQILI